MEVEKCISPSSVTTENNQVSINDLDDDSLGMIFDKLSYIDRMRIERVCQRWYAVSRANWCNYFKRLRIDEDLLPSYHNITETENVLKKILQRSSPYIEEITFSKVYSTFCKRFSMGTIKWIAELCPKLKRLNAGSLMLNDDDWLACSNLEAFSFFLARNRGAELGVLFRNNKRLRRLTISDGYFLAASDFDHLDPGQLEFLQIEFSHDFQFTAEIADKLAESLVELKYSTTFCSTLTFQHFGKLKNLRSLDFKLGMEWLNIEFIPDIAKNCRKLEYLFLAFSSCHAYAENIFEPLFNLPYLRRLVIIVEKNDMPRKDRDRLLRRAAHLEFFVIDSCAAKCNHATYSFEFCDRHRRDRLSSLKLSSYNNS